MVKVKKLLLQFCRFGIVGIVCLAVDCGVLVLLTECTRIGYFFSSAISFTLSVILNYILSMRFVFKGKENANKLVELLIFVVLSLIGLGFNQLILWIAVESWKLYYMVAKILSTWMVTIYNFISRKIFLEQP